MIPIGVLVPIDPERPAPPPEARPVGRAALALREEGIEAVFGDVLQDGCMTGVVATPGSWRPAVGVPVAAVHDRYPSQRRARRFAAARRGLAGRPMGNALAITMLCRDKLACQRALDDAGVGHTPTVEADPERFAERLDAWGVGFLKPRFGALGVSVRRVVPGDPLPAWAPGVVPGRDDPTLLQRAVAPPPDWAGRSVRVLCQRLPGGGWQLNPAVLRQSAVDPVVNAARGAQVVVAADALAASLMARIHTLTRRVCAAIGAGPEGELAVELGVDLVLDGADQPWVVEVNSRPRGRLEVLSDLDPDRFGAQHIAACAAPLRYLAALVGRSGGVRAP